MLRFACTRCKFALQAPDTAGGSKLNCPQCGQRLRIPTPPPNKTTLAPLLAHEPDQTDKPKPQTLVAAPYSPPPLIVPPVLAHRWGLRRWLVRGGALAGLLAVGLIALLVTKAVSPAVGSVAEAREEPRIEAEELVKRYILNNAADAKAVKFLRWGPHMTPEEVRALRREAGAEKDAMWDATFMTRLFPADFANPFPTPHIVRVSWKDPNYKPLLRDENAAPAVRDSLFAVVDRQVNPWHWNIGHRVWGIDKGAGDEWKVAMRRELAKTYPAIRLPPP